MILAGTFYQKKKKASAAEQTAGEEPETLDGSEASGTEAEANDQPDRTESGTQPAEESGEAETDTKKQQSTDNE